jgi:hypothetical protein
MTVAPSPSITIGPPEDWMVVPTGMFRLPAAVSGSLPMRIPADPSTVGLGPMVADFPEAIEMLRPPRARIREGALPIGVYPEFRN